MEGVKGDEEIKKGSKGGGLGAVKKDDGIKMPCAEVENLPGYECICLDLETLQSVTKCV